jgi:hypothetical protein
MRLSAATIAAVLATTACAWPRADDDALVGHWPLAVDARDYSGHDRHGQTRGIEFVEGGPSQFARRAVRFDGGGSFIEVPAAVAPRLGNGDFTVAAWVQVSDERDDVPGDLISQFDASRRRGFTLSVSQNAVTSSQANTRNIHFGIDNGRLEPEWTDHGRLGNAIFVFALAVHDGQLFAGTCEVGRDEAGHVLRFDGGTRWIDCGSPDRANAITALAVYDGQLYAASGKYRLAGSALPESENSNTGGGVFRYAGGQHWEDCGRLTDTEAVGSLVVYRGRLYASSLYRPACFFRYEGGRDWTSLDTPGGKRVEAMCVFNGRIFASSYDEAHVFRYDGTAWTDCGQLGDSTNTQTYSFAVHGGKLYAGTWRSGRVFRYDGDNDWHDMGRLGEELEVMGMIVHNGKLYAGTLPLAEVYRFDGGSRWTRVGVVDQTPDVKYRRAWTFAEFQGRVFCGTLPSGRVLSIEAGKNVTVDREIRSGWHHIAALRRGNRLQLYVDGKPAAVSTPFDPAAFDISTDRPLMIGFGPNDYFNGSLSDVRLYHRALTEIEVAGLAVRTTH